MGFNLLTTTSHRPLRTRLYAGLVHQYTTGVRPPLRHQDPDALAVVIGGVRGLGGAFVRHLTENGRWAGPVIATSRQPNSSFTHERLQTLHDIDPQCPQSLRRVVDVVQGKHGRVDFLLNACGILHNGSASDPELALKQISPDWTLSNFGANCLAHVMPLVALERFLQGKIAGRPAPLVTSLSARVGSITDNALGGWYSYRLSKAALNQFLKTASLELRRRGVIVTALHPGTVKTHLSEPFVRKGLAWKVFESDESSEKLLAVLEGLQDVENTGKFLDYRGESIPW